MTILNPTQERALVYIRAANYGGCNPTPSEIMEWVERPDKKRGKVRRRVIKAPSVNLGLSNASLALVKAASMDMSNSRLKDTLATFNKQIMDTVGPLPSVGALGAQWRQDRVIEEQDPDETLIEQLLRFRWIRFNATGVGIMLTDLGRALLRADTDETDDDDVVFINGDDPLAWGSLVGKIADIGDCLIVDPYLKPEQYLDIAKFTGVTRVILKRPDKPQKLVTWQVNHRLAGDSIDIRIAEQHQMHDRFIVGDNAVYTLGCSLEGVGRKPTILNAHRGLVAGQIRKAAEELWNSAEAISAGADEDAEA